MPDIPVEITRADVEQVTRFLADKRRIKHWQSVRVNGTREQATRWEINGKLGEVIFARHFGYAVDWSVHSGGDHGIDFRLWNGATVDVKAAGAVLPSRFNFKLAVGDRDPVPDELVLTLIADDLTHGVIVGRISGARFAQMAHRETEWQQHRSDRARPWIVYRLHLSQHYPPPFWACLNPFINTRRKSADTDSPRR